VADGGQRVDTAGDARWHYFGGWKARFTSGVEMVSQSRAFFEWKLRERLAQRANVSVLCGDVSGVAADATRRVHGARVRLRDPDTAEPELIAADLVVDASGRGSRMPQWLADLGFERPPESEVGVDVGYATRFYRRTDTPRDWKALLVHPKVTDTRCGVLLPVEGGRWMLTLVGWYGDHPPGDEAGFLDFAASLAAHEIHDAVKDAEAVSPIALHKFPSNRRRHYERVTVPDGVAVLGDAACSFNPVYAQGMATGALGAQALDARSRSSGGCAVPATSPASRSASSASSRASRTAPGCSRSMRTSAAPRPWACARPDAAARSGTPHGFTSSPGATASPRSASSRSCIWCVRRPPFHPYIVLRALTR
jgi:2-polyprenyl-6-methoxyphenol hydroxylase-like FAD-dependent oxidoreductase